MRVLIAHSFYRLPGGEDNYVRDQLALLSESANEVALLQRENQELDETLATAARMAYSRRLYAEVLAELRSFKPDLVHLHNAYPSLGPAVHLATYKEKIPLVMTVHNLRLRCPNGLMYTEGAVCRRCQRGNYAHATLHECFSSRKQGLAYASSLWLHRFVLRLESKVTQFIAPSEFMRQRLVDWGIASDRVSLVRCVTPIPPEVPDLGAHGIFVGRVSAEKGLDILLQGLAGAGDPPFRIVGDGPEFGDVARLAQRLGLKRTEFVGKVDKYQVSELMRDSRFVVIPSRWEENAPLVAAEAMALGRPLIVSRIGGLPEFVAGGAGISFPVDDVSELAEAIRRLTDDAESCRDMGNHAREFALREFSGDRHVVRLQELYDAVSR